MKKYSHHAIHFLDGLHIPDLASFYTYLLDTAASIVLAGEELEPLIFVLSNDGKLAVMPFTGSKDNVTGFQQTVVKEPMVRACALVFEAWISSHERTAEAIQPRLDPARTEAIAVSILTNGRQALTLSPIKRPGNTVEKAPFKWLDEVEGKFTGRFVR